MWVLAWLGPRNEKSHSKTESPGNDAALESQMNGLNVLVSPELRNSETRERSESYVEDLGTLAEATRSRRRTAWACAWTMPCMVMCELAARLRPSVPGAGRYPGGRAGIPRPKRRCLGCLGF